MEEQIIAPPPQPKPQTGFSVKQTLAIMFGAMVVTAAVTILIIKIFLFPAPFKPVVLSEKEEQHLSQKLSAFEGFSPTQTKEPSAAGPLEPEQYTEDDDARKIDFTEREINAMMAKNTDLADKVAIDLADDMISVKILIPLDPDFPMLGGKTFKAKAGAELAYRGGRPVVKLRGVSLMGVPMPNSWLGGLKNIDLVQEFGGDEGFWKAFADGVESIGVKEGFLHVELKP